MFPLETLELPDWSDLIPTAVNALRDVQTEMDRSTDEEIQSSKGQNM